MDKSAYELFMSFGECHRLLKDLAHELRSRSGVTEVVHWTDMTNVPTDLPNVEHAFRLEEFVDAELENGEAVCWCLEVTFTPKRISIEADIVRNHAKGQDAVATIADCEYWRLDNAASEITEVARQLCESDPL